MFESLNLTAYDLSIDTLDMHAHQDSFHRFDKVRKTNTPCAEYLLRRLPSAVQPQVQSAWRIALEGDLPQDRQVSALLSSYWTLLLTRRAYSFIEGRYLAELSKEVFTDLQQSKYQMAEYRISIYGR